VGSHGVGGMVETLAGVIFVCFSQLRHIYVLLPQINLNISRNFLNTHHDYKFREFLFFGSSPSAKKDSNTQILNKFYINSIISCYTLVLISKLEKKLNLK
jgi:hypothetical protein